MRPAWALVAALLALQVLAGCFDRTTFPRCRGGDEVPEFAPGDQAIALCVGKRERTALAVVPAGLATPAPLLLMLHGGGGDGEQMRRDDGMDAVAAELGIVLVYAEGTPARRGMDVRTWNAVHCCGTAFADRTPDVAFLGELLDRLVDDWPIDAGRVGVAGHSNGAMMAYRLAAERSDVVTHVMAVAGAVGGEPDPGDPLRVIDEPSQPVSVLIVHARDDPRVPYEGGQGQNLDGPRVDLAVADAVHFWRTADGITAAPGPQERADGVDAQRHTGGARGTSILVLTTQGGHGWPGADDGRTQSPRAPDAAQEIGRFLVERQRDPPGP